MRDVERVGGAGPYLSAQARVFSGERGRDCGRPTRHVPVRPEVAAGGPSRKPEVDRRQPSVLEQARYLLGLLPGRGLDEPVTAFLEPAEDRHQLDQLAGGAVDHQDQGRTVIGDGCCNRSGAGRVVTTR